MTFEAGARWSKDLKAYAGTDLCELPHVALVTAGTLRVVLSDSVENYLKVFGRPEQITAWRAGRAYVADLAENSAGR